MEKAKRRTGDVPAGGREEVSMSDGKSGLQLRSLLRKSGELELSLANIPTPEPADDEVVVRVRDTGVGIQKEYLKTIFEPFTQLAPVVRNAPVL